MKINKRAKFLIFIFNKFEPLKENLINYQFNNQLESQRLFFQNDLNYPLEQK